MPNEIENMTDEELVSITGRATIGTPNGNRAQEAQAELTRRLMVSISKLENSSSKYSKSLVLLTIILGVLAAAQVILFII